MPDAWTDRPVLRMTSIINNLLCHLIVKPLQVQSIDDSLLSLRVNSFSETIQMKALHQHFGVVWFVFKLFRKAKLRNVLLASMVVLAPYRERLVLVRAVVKKMFGCCQVVLALYTDNRACGLFHRKSLLFRFSSSN